MRRDDFDSICFDALSQFKPIAITLESRKVYVGYVADGFEPKEGSSLTLLPVYSGYREKDTLSFKLISAYDVVREFFHSDRLGIEDYYIAFPRDKILSLHIFNDHLYKPEPDTAEVLSETTFEVPVLANEWLGEDGHKVDL